MSELYNTTKYNIVTLDDMVAGELFNFASVVTDINPELYMVVDKTSLDDYMSLNIADVLVLSLLTFAVTIVTSDTTVVKNEIQQKLTTVKV